MLGFIPFLALGQDQAKSFRLVGKIKNVAMNPNGYLCNTV